MARRMLHLKRPHDLFNTDVVYDALFDLVITEIIHSRIGKP